MMKEADYSVGLQYEYLLFHYFVIVPRMGPRPGPGGQPRYKSFMCDDFSPVEYSWRWDGDRPDVRFCVEPIGPLAGTAVDPFNQAAMKELLHSLETSNLHIDASLFWKFARYLEPRGHGHRGRTRMGLVYLHRFRVPSQRNQREGLIICFEARLVALPFFDSSFTKVMGSVHGDEQGVLPYAKKLSRRQP